MLPEVRVYSPKQIIRAGCRAGLWTESAEFPDIELGSLAPSYTNALRKRLLEGGYGVYPFTTTDRSTIPAERMVIGWPA